jgi:hypothetical protein
MNTPGKLVCALLLALGATAPAIAHGRVFFGFNFGIPVYPPPYYYPPPIYYAPPPVVAVPSAPPVYVEQQTQPQSSAQPENWWYYCPESKTYYPYVKECPSPWQRVPPRPQ